MGALQPFFNSITVREEILPPALVDILDFMEPNFEVELMEEVCKPTEEELAIYAQEIKHIFEGFQIHTYEDCEMISYALENILIPNCVYLLSLTQTNAMPEEYQSILNNIADRLDSPQNHVFHPDHVEHYSDLVKQTIGQTLANLSMFSQNLAAKMREEQQRQAQFKQLLAATSDISSAELYVTLFLLSVELINREQSSILSAKNMWTPVLEKIRDEHITTQQINDLSRADRNRLVFDGASSEAFDIIEKLAAERSDMMQRRLGPY